MIRSVIFSTSIILVPKAYNPSGLRQKSRALGETITTNTKQQINFINNYQLKEEHAQLAYSIS